MPDYTLDRFAFLTMKKQLEGIKDLVNMDDISNVISTIALHLASKRVIHVLGIGKNSFVARSMVSTMISCNINAEFQTPENIFHGGMQRFQEEDAVIFLTKSGTTKELLEVNNLFKDFVNRMLRIIITEEKDITDTNNLLTQSDFMLCYPKCGECDQRGLIPMTSLILSQVLAHALIVCIAVCRQTTYGEFYSGHPGGAIGQVSAVLQYAQKDLPLFDNQSFVIGDTRIYT